MPVSPASILSSVVLPAPLRPASVMRSLRSSLNETSRNSGEPAMSLSSADAITTAMSAFEASPSRVASHGRVEPSRGAGTLGVWCRVDRAYRRGIRTHSVGERLAALAARQHGVVSLAQLRALGLTTGRDRAVGCGGPASPAPPGRLRGRARRPITPRAGPGGGARVRARSAAEPSVRRRPLGDTSGTRSRIEVTVPRPDGPGPGIVVHRTRSLTDEDRAVLDGIPVTEPGADARRPRRRPLRAAAGRRGPRGRGAAHPRREAGRATLARLRGPPRAATGCGACSPPTAAAHR